MQRQRGAEKEELFRPSPHPPETGNGLRPADASESVRGIGAKINAEVCAAKSAQRFLLWWIAPVELRGEAENRNGQEQVQKKTAKKIAVIRVELNFRAGVSAATPIGWAKRSSFFHRLQGPEFRLSRRRIRGTVCTANSRLFFRPRVYSGLPAPAPCFGSKRLPRFRLRVPTS